MAGSSIKRSQFVTYLNVGTVGAPDYKLVGDGITTAVVNYNPEVTTETYIHQNSGNTEIESYKPTMPIEATAKKGDDVFDFVDGLRRTRAVLDDAKSDALLVYLYETPVAGAYPAEQQPVSLQVDTFGGDGGKSTKINYTINFLGDPTLGTFDPSNSSFTAAP